MADKTFGVKVDEELFSDVKNLIENSGKTSKEWFEQLITFAQIQQLKEGAGDFSKDVSELEIHTQRIYELSANMIKRATFLKDHAVKEVEEQLIKTKQDYQKLKEQADLMEQELRQALTSYKQNFSEKEELKKRNEQLNKQIESNQLLINQYKEKVDTVTGLVTQYQQYQTDNEQLKEEIQQQKEQHQAVVNELTQDNHQKDEQIKALEQQLEQLKQQHQLDIERMNEKKEIEIQQKTLEIKEQYQEKIEQINDEHTKAISGKVDMKMVAELFDQLKADGKFDQSKPTAKQKQQPTK